MRADSLLTAHVVMIITRPQDSNGRAIQPVDNSLPFVSFEGRRGTRIPSLHAYSTPKLFWKVKRQLSNILGSTTVLDIIDNFLQPQIYSGLTKAAPHLSTLRSLYNHETHSSLYPLEPKYDIESPASLFLHIGTQERTPPLLGQRYNHPMARTADYIIFFPTVPVGTRRAVLNFQLNTRDPRIFFCLLGDTFPPTLEEMTIIFTPIHGPLPAPTRSDSLRTATWFEFGTKILINVPKVRFTIVGMAALHPDTFDRDGPYASNQELYQCLIQDMYRGALVLGLEGATTLEVLENNIQWVTHEEYRQRVDPAQWEMQMIR